MKKRQTCIPKIYRILAAAACAWSCLPAARADIFVSQNSSLVYSYSELTGAYHLAFSDYESCGIGVTCPSHYTTGVAIGPDGNLYVADLGYKDIVGFNPSTGAATGVNFGVGPYNANSALEGITFGPGGNFYVADNYGYIWFFGPPPSFTPLGAGKFSCTPAGSTTSCYPIDLAFGPDGNLYVSDGGSGGVLEFSVSGNTLSFIGQFVSRPSANAFPSGLHFSPGSGNLYVSYALPVLNSTVFYDAIFEYSWPSGSPVSLNGGAGIDYWGPQDFGFGPSGNIIVPQTYGFDEYSPSTGYWLANFGSYPLYTGNPDYNPEEVNAGFVAIGGPICAFCTAAPPLQLYAPVGLDSGQHLRLTVVEGPVWVPPGVAVEVQLGFQNSQGVAVGPSQVFNLNPGRTASLDLDASTLISSGRIEIQPVVTAVPGSAAPMAIINGSAEVYSTASGFGSIFYAGVPATGGNQVAGPPVFLPQGVALGQTIQINAVAPPDSPCVAMLGFKDDNGNTIGPSQQVSLNPGQMASLTFNPSKYTKSGRQEYVPQMTPNNPTGGQGMAPACLGSAEVYSTKTGATSTYQLSSPAVGTLPAVQ